MIYERKILKRNRFDFISELINMLGDMHSAEHQCIRSYNLVEFLQSNWKGNEK